ncbi:MAG: ABC transporter permease subunit [Gemmatimonadales bacterium]|nr:ABC transporter permease subunit [Gemmatimonadales bacterium]NIN13330.1 ABC transporter permease subunit [Gemmatimonadales bacterium]NIN51333.1 ABC transporter permease subunit [Gemmatimonadales bacterium]NIP08797.1 ABC transporter permease subunit [Gemmatimonadales bacterium]NIQ99791.1 ABC transporter permease subunit [Gemmatimonadales bacterium]
MKALRTLLADGRAATGLAILGVFCALALLAPILAPADPAAQRDILATRFLAPLAVGSDGVMHWLGTDAFGRDVYSRLIYGARISLAVGFLSVAVSIGLGTAIGVTSALAGGVTERALMAITDAALAMPRIVLLLALVTLWEPSLVLVVLVLGFTGWMTVARLARAEVKGLLTRPFVEAARSSGLGRMRLLWRHLIPNASTPLIVAAALGVGNAIMLEAGLSFLGLGVPAPAPSWGNMIAGGRDALVNAPWVATFPGLAVALAVVSCNLIGDGTRDVLDPTTLHRPTRWRRGRRGRRGRSAAEGGGPWLSGE